MNSIIVYYKSKLTTSIWLNTDNHNLLNFHIVFKERVLDNFKQKWFNEVENSRSVYTYKFLKLLLDLKII